MGTATLTLTEFLLARIAEDEAGEEVHHPIYDGHAEPFKVRVARVEPSARWQRECEAKRQIVERHSSFHNGWHDDAGEPMQTCAHDMKPWPCPDLLDLAQPYADHPDYRPEWKP